MIKEQMDIGMIGLGVMGSSLARNMVSKGFAVTCYDWDETLRNRFAQNFQDDKLYHAPDLAAFISSLSHPRKIMLMIKAGSSVDPVAGEGECDHRWRELAVCRHRPQRGSLGGSRNPFYWLRGFRR